MNRWFPVGLNDAASFYQVLSNAALNVNNARLRTTGAESIDSLTYHMKALSLVRKRIESLVDTTSDGLLSTVIGFACYNVCYDFFNSKSLSTNYIGRVGRLCYRSVSLWRT